MTIRNKRKELKSSKEGGARPGKKSASTILQKKSNPRGGWGVGEPPGKLGATSMSFKGSQAWIKSGAKND